MSWGDVSIEIPGCPPSLNQAGAKAGVNWTFVKAKKKWQSDIFFALQMERAAPARFDFVHVSAVLRFPTNNRRDAGNYRSILEKSCGDALTAGGWLPDDTPDYFEFGTVRFEYARGMPKLTTMRFRFRED